MSILEQINNVTTEEELFQLVEEHLLDFETPLSWSGSNMKVIQKRLNY